MLPVLSILGYQLQLAEVTKSLSDIEQATKGFRTTDLLVVIFLAFMLVDKIMFWVNKRKGNGNGGLRNSVPLLADSRQPCVRSAEFALLNRAVNETNESLKSSVEINRATSEALQALVSQTVEQTGLLTDFVTWAKRIFSKRTKK